MDLCILFGPLIGVAVQILKRIPFVGKNPKVVAAVLSIVATLLGTGAAWKTNLSAIILCVVTTLSGAIATHEIAVKPAVKWLSPPPPPSA
jgi:hypothetical protein